MRLSLLAPAAVLILGACGDPETPAASTEAGVEASVPTAEPDIPPTPAVHSPGQGGAPLWTLPYPQAEVTSSVRAPGGRGGMLTFQTDAHPDTVVAYYRQRAEEAGLGAGAAMTAEDTRQFAAEGAGGEALAVVAAERDGMTVVTLTWDAAG